MTECVKADIEQVFSQCLRLPSSVFRFNVRDFMHTGPLLHGKAAIILPNAYQKVGFVGHGAALGTPTSSPQTRSKRSWR